MPGRRSRSGAAQRAARAGFAARGGYEPPDPARQPDDATAARLGVRPRLVRPGDARQAFDRLFRGGARAVPTTLDHRGSGVRSGGQAGVTDGQQCLVVGKSERAPARASSGGAERRWAPPVPTRVTACRSCARAGARKTGEGVDERCRKCGGEVALLVFPTATRARVWLDGWHDLERRRRANGKEAFTIGSFRTGLLARTETTLRAAGGDRKAGLQEARGRPPDAP